AVCDKIGQIRMSLAQVKNVDSLKLCVSGFSMVLMTMGISTHFGHESFFGSRRLVASGSLFILSDGVRVLLIPSSLPTTQQDRNPHPSRTGRRVMGSYLSLKDGISSLEGSSTKKTPAHTRLRIRPTVGLNLRATPSTVLSGTKGAGLTILTLVYFLSRIDRRLSPKGGERAGRIQRAQREGRGHGGESRCTVVFAIKFCPMVQTLENLAFSRTEIEAKNRFRRDVVWSQRSFHGQNEYAHRHQHHREPRNAKFQIVDIFNQCQPSSDSFTNGHISTLIDTE
ncbi:hypothetical protein PRIPAC_92048, partial [Pristionchus pacificus]|uniref:Uncharacterized protein n=1 Tax=Pristionchus pacificus TaxID=54126 RepID=A0A2A6CQY3_PRIPA